MGKRVEFVWPDEFVERVDAARGDVPRSRFVRRELEGALGESQSRVFPRAPVADPLVEEFNAASVAAARQAKLNKVRFKK